MIKLIFFLFISSIKYSYCLTSSTSTLTPQNGLKSMEHVGSGMDMQINMSEYELRELLFRNYSVNNIPVLNHDDNIVLKYGLQIESLENFNQISENIKFNILIVQEWTDHLLNWNNNIHTNHSHSLEYITLLSNQIWKPDLELYNAAEKPIVFDLKGGLKLFNNGKIYYSRPTQYSFSCKLDLKMFPFDKQNCEMIFGSWKYSKSKLDLKPFNENDITSNISVNPKFSHNEWNIINVNVKHEDIEYLCCPGEYYPNSFFTITLERNYHKYMVVIIMTIFITLSDFFVTFIKVDNYKRTFILVFIPLTLLWLQIYIASKIPVIEYSTLMEKILFSCFVITILNAFESAILFIIITNVKNRKLPYSKTIYRKDVKLLNIISYFGDKYYELNLNNKITNYVHNFDNFYRFVIILFFSIYVGYYIDTA
jgi:nicotinic acetylcholine receptor, invertebrate